MKGKKWILHLIDASTRYTAAMIISLKRKNVVVEKFCKIWLAYFGAPRKVHSDCGGEFSTKFLPSLMNGLVLRLAPLLENCHGLMVRWRETTKLSLKHL